MPPKTKESAPRYILSLDDLPKVVEADGVVYPVYLPISDAARLFSVDPRTLWSWIKTNNFPVLMPSHTHQARVPVKEMVEWVKANTYVFRESGGKYVPREASSKSDDGEGSS